MAVSAATNYNIVRGVFIFVDITYLSLCILQLVFYRINHPPSKLVRTKSGMQQQFSIKPMLNLFGAVYAVFLLIQDIDMVGYFDIFDAKTNHFLTDIGFTALYAGITLFAFVSLRTISLANKGKSKTFLPRVIKVSVASVIMCLLVAIFSGVAMYYDDSYWPVAIFWEYLGACFFILSVMIIYAYVSLVRYLNKYGTQRNANKDLSRWRKFIIGMVTVLIFYEIYVILFGVIRWHVPNNTRPDPYGVSTPAPGEKPEFEVSYALYHGAAKFLQGMFIWYAWLKLFPNKETNQRETVSTARNARKSQQARGGGGVRSSQETPDNVITVNDADRAPETIEVSNQPMLEDDNRPQLPTPTTNGGVSQEQSLEMV